MMIMFDQKQNLLDGVKKETFFSECFCWLGCGSAGTGGTSCGSLVPSAKILKLKLLCESAVVQPLTWDASRLPLLLKDTIMF